MPSLTCNAIKRKVVTISDTYTYRGSCGIYYGNLLTIEVCNACNSLQLPDLDQTNYFYAAQFDVIAGTN